MAIDIETIGVAVDSAQLSAGTRALDGFGKSADSASYKADQLSKSNAKAAQNTDLMARSVQSSVSYLGRLAVGLGSIAAARSIIRQIDEYTKLNAQLKLATRSQEEFNAAQTDVRRISTVAQSDLASISVLYARLNNSLRDTGASQQQVARITETVGLALKVSGATATESASAMLQLSQAFGSGVLRGEEFNAVNEAAPALMRALAEAIGVPVGALRKMASEGQLSSDVLSKAFGDQKLLEKYRQQAKEVETISGAFQLLKNTALDAIGTVSEKTGAAKFFSESIKGLAVSLQLLLDVAKAGPIDYSKFLPNKAQAFVLEGELGRYGGVPSKGPVQGVPDARPVIKRGDLSAIPANMGVLPRIDIGEIGQVPESFKKLQAEYAKFKEDNPLKDVAEANKQYADSLKLVNDLEAVGILSMQDATRYRKQLSEQLKASTKANIESNAVASDMANIHADLIKKAQELNAPQESQIQQLERLMNGYTLLDSSVRKYLQTQIEIARENELEKYLDDQRYANEEVVYAINQQAAALEDQVANYGALDSAATKANLNNLRGLRDTLAAEGLATQALDDRIKAMERLSAAQFNLEQKNAVAKQEKEREESIKRTVDQAKREYDKLNEQLSRGITDALFRGFENGKSFIQNFKDVLINAFKTLTIQPIIEGILENSGIAKVLTEIPKIVLGAIPSFANASTPNGLTATGGLADLGKLLKGGLDSLSGGMTDSITKLGAWIANGNGGIADKIGGFMGQYGSQIATSLAFLPAVYSLLKGDIKGAAFSGGGAALGAVFGGPAGAAIGATLGSMLGSVFGRNKNPRYTGQFQSVYGNNGLIRSGQVNAQGKDTAIFNTQLGAVNNAFAANLTGLLDIFGKDIGRLSIDSIFSYKKGKQFIGGTFGELNGKGFGFQSQGFGKDGEAAMKAYLDMVLGKAFASAVQATDLSKEIKQLFNGMTTQKQVTGLINNLAMLKSASEELNDELGITIDQAAAIAVANGSRVKFTKLLADTALAFMKPSEQLLIARDNINKAMTDILGSFSMPASVEEFQSLLKGIDVSTKSGRKDYANLIKLFPNFNSYLSSLDSVKTGVKNSVLDLLSPAERQARINADLQAQLAKLNITMPASVEELISLADSIDYTTEAGLDFATVMPTLAAAFKEAADEAIAISSRLREEINSATLANLLPEQQLSKLQSEFDLAYAKALTSSGTALNEQADILAGLISPILDSAKNVYASGSGFQDIKTYVLDAGTFIADKLDSKTASSSAQIVTNTAETNKRMDALLTQNASSYSQMLNKLDKIERELTEIKAKARLEASR